MIRGRSTLILGLIAVIGAMLLLSRKGEEARLREALLARGTPAFEVEPAPGAAPLLQTAASARALAGRASRGGAGAATPSDGGATSLDRQRRDATREQIYKAFGQAVPPAGAGSLDAGPIDADYLRARIREDFFPMARQCYEELLARSPRARGKVTLDFTLVGDDKVGGVVDRAEIDDAGTSIPDPAFTTCMRESMLSMSFRPPPNDGTITVKYPFVLSPDDDDGGGAVP